MCRRQALAPFGAAALEDELTALRAHADAKAVRFGAAAIVRLKSSLRHTLHLSINVSTEKGKPIEMDDPLSSCRTRALKADAQIRRRKRSAVGRDTPFDAADLL